MKRAGTIFAVGVLGVAFVSAALAEDVEALVVEGEAVFTRVCFDCHNATEEGPDMVAPPIFAAKNHYSGFAAREDFVAAVSGYLLDPTEQTAQMPGAVRKFGLMPPPDMTEAEAVAVAEYLYATDFSLPDWYLVHYQEEHGTAPAAN